jgi:hypothetical protein
MMRAQKIIGGGNEKGFPCGGSSWLVFSKGLTMLEEGGTQLDDGLDYAKGLSKEPKFMWFPCGK